mmetsp:Transcript_34525/g.78843  ORF Transcript_34525/g.78843 Transcript_34525/m.78843 type:complete len:603 (+) Transcript_34525:58-1866(+)
MACMSAPALNAWQRQAMQDFSQRAADTRALLNELRQESTNVAEAPVVQPDQATVVESGVTSQESCNTRSTPSQPKEAAPTSTVSTASRAGKSRSEPASRRSVRSSRATVGASQLAMVERLQAKLRRLRESAEQEKGKAKEMAAVVQDLASSFGESHPSSKPTVNGSKANTPRQPWQQAPKPKQRPRPKAAAGGGGLHTSARAAGKIGTGALCTPMDIALHDLRALKGTTAPPSTQRSTVQSHTSSDAHLGAQRRTAPSHSSACSASLHSAGTGSAGSSRPGSAASGSRLVMAAARASSVPPGSWRRLQQHPRTPRTPANVVPTPRTSGPAAQQGGEPRTVHPEPLSTQLSGFALPAPPISSVAAAMTCQARESLVMLAEAAARATGACQQCAPLATALQRAVASEVAALEAAAQATGSDQDLPALQRRVDDVQNNVTQGLQMLRAALGDTRGDAALPAPQQQLREATTLDDAPLSRSRQTHSCSAVMPQPLSLRPSLATQPTLRTTSYSSEMNDKLVASAPATAVAAHCPMAGPAPTAPHGGTASSIISNNGPAAPLSQPPMLASALSNVAADMKEALDAIRCARESKNGRMVSLPLDTVRR